MKNRTLIPLSILLMFAFGASAQEPQETIAQESYEEMEEMLGTAPVFLRVFPEAGVPGAWDAFKALQLGDKTALEPAQKEMIGYAVAAQIPCDYCVYFHTEAAMAAGATEQELEEAVAMAALTRHWSTVLNGSQIDRAAFESEVDGIVNYLERTARGDARRTSNREPEALADAERTLGTVPSFLKAFPDAAVAPAWREMKAIQLNPDTALSGKEKELIGLAVAAQVPCEYCVYFHRQAAEFHGASEAEMEEAVALAAMTRHWSTVLNGAMVDETEFRRETDRILNYVREKSAASRQSSGMGTARAAND